MPQVVTDRPNGRKKVTFVCEGPSRTEQGHRDEVDINSIMRRYRRTGMLPPSAYGGMPTYGDFSETGSYHEALNQVLAAQDTFMTLPAELRKRFRNDPGELIDFLNDPGNREEAMNLGLIERQKEASEAPVASPAGASAVPATSSPTEPSDGGTPVDGSSSGDKGV